MALCRTSLISLGLLLATVAAPQGAATGDQQTAFYGPIPSVVGAVTRCSGQVNGLFPIKAPGASPNPDACFGVDFVGPFNVNVRDIFHTNVGFSADVYEFNWTTGEFVVFEHHDCGFATYTPTSTRPVLIVTVRLENSPHCGGPTTGRISVESS